MSKTKIEWADVVWNPVTGCTKVSQGCKNCYAKTLHNMRHLAYLEGKKLPEQYSVPFEVVVMHPDRLDLPSHWSKPRRVFVNSMSDLFHESLIDRAEWGDFIVHLWSTMLHNLHHTFMILTKRPAIMEKEVKLLIGAGFPVLPNVWLGTSVEDQKAADERIPLLLQTPAAVRFVSYEPALGPVDFDGPFGISGPENYRWDDPIEPCSWLDGIDWVISGGESGPNARPMHPDWARSIRDQCVSSGVPFFFKQWGEWAEVYQFTGSNGNVLSDPLRHCLFGSVKMQRVGKQTAGCLLDSQEWKQFPEVG